MGEPPPLHHHSQLCHLPQSGVAAGGQRATLPNSAEGLVWCGAARGPGRSPAPSPPHLGRPRSVCPSPAVLAEILLCAFIRTCASLPTSSPCRLRDAIVTRVHRVQTRFQKEPGTRNQLQPRRCRRGPALGCPGRRGQDGCPPPRRRAPAGRLLPSAPPRWPSWRGAGGAPGGGAVMQAARPYPLRLRRGRDAIGELVPSRPVLSSRARSGAAGSRHGAAG